ncbi:MAG: hypothetical protein A3H31_08595 [Gallionellales bacterium RIFCSPLOWO2_02_FULL_57_47]|nr:MAG: hypothetical protein A3H31_08595 [Gallionellales bacterium RIFCSPLOWO2_02_FULL_57_47]
MNPPSVDIEGANILRNFKLILVVLITAGLQTAAFAQVSIGLPCQNDDRKCAAKLRSQSPIKKMSYWESAFKKPVEKRVGSAPDELVAYLNLDNIVGGFPNKPQAVTIPDDFLKDVSDAIAELPGQVKQLIAKKLAGIYFVKDLGGTGYTDYINKGIFGLNAGFIVLDIDVLSKSTANAWATWKERTPFIADPRYRLDATIEDNGQDNRKNAIQYILLHELGHILSLGENIHPQWGQSKNKISLDDYPFARISWKAGNQNDSRYISRFEKQFPLRKNTVYYFGAKLNGDQMISVYDQLEATNFPTLYAATSPSDDFAESFVSYVHTELLKRPLEIRIYHNGQIAKTYKSCWEEKRCATKRKFLEAFLESR